MKSPEKSSIYQNVIKIFIAALCLTMTSLTIVSPFVKNYEPDGNAAQTPSEQPMVDKNKISETQKQNITEQYGKLPLSFEINQGQTDSQVKFISRGSGYSLFLTPTEAVMSLQKPSTPKKDKFDFIETKKTATQPEKTETDVVRMKLVGANPSPEIKGLNELSGKSNYFIGNDQNKWRTNVSHYAKVQYENVYPGIDLVYYGNQRQLEYDFIVAPEINPKVISIVFDGVDNLKIDAKGNLLLRTAFGEIKQLKPIVYQEADNERHEISSNFVIKGENSIGFEIANYDTCKPLIIDPILAYSTYFGGNQQSVTAYNISVDSSGSSYIVGGTNSPVFPTTTGSFQTTQPTCKDFPCQDIFISKLSPNGSTLVYSAYLGGSSLDTGLGLAVDIAGNAYITGEIHSNNFPTTAGAFQPIDLDPSGSDGIVVKLNSTGSGLIYSTYICGGRQDTFRAITVDSSGNAYVTGDTNSFDFPTLNAIRSGISGPFDAFVTKLNVSGSAIIYSTYLGGASYEAGYDIKVDSQNNVIVVGGTSSDFGFPLVNAAQANYRGVLDAFVTKLNSTGSSIVFSTYFGGSDGDLGYALDTDASGNIYVTGEVRSFDFPITSGAFQTVKVGSLADAFVLKMTNLGAVVYSTYLGGNAHEIGNGIAVDMNGYVYLTGTTNSINFPFINSFLSPSSSSSAFVTKVNVTGDSLIYSTRLGGNTETYFFGTSSNAIAVDNQGNAYITGRTNTLDFPIINALQSTNIRASNSTNSPGIEISFVTKIADVPPNQVPTANAGNAQIVKYQATQTPVLLDGTASGDADGDLLTYEWREGSTILGTGATLNVGLSFGSHTIVLTVTDPAGASSQDTVIINVVCPSINISPNVVPEGRVGVPYSMAFNQTGGSANTILSVSGTLPPGLTFANGEISGTPTAAGDYSFTVMANDGNVCGSSQNYILAVRYNLPTILAVNINRTQGNPSANSQISSVNDDADAEENLNITINGGSAAIVNGVAVSNVHASSGGAVTADVVADCAATDASFTVAVTNSGNLTSTATLTVNVLPNTPPVLGNYPSAGTINVGTGAVITPDVLPSDNVGISNISVSANGFAGSLSVDAATGVVSVSNASPAGNYTINIVATDNCGAATTRSFGLIVNGAPNVSGQSLMRQRGDAGTVSTIAIVSDDLTPAGGLTVTPGNVPTGISIGNLANNNGTITASVGVDCSAALGNNFVPVQVTDGGGLTTNAVLTVNVKDNPPPTVTITSPPSGAVYQIGSTVNFAGSFTDNTGDVHMAQWTFSSANNSFSQAGAVDEMTGIVGTTYTFNSSGVYLVSLSITDECGNVATANTINDDLQAMVVVYDPTAGFVTGGGWINSPTGAYRADMTLTGKASFGFVSKYQNGANVPTGNTEFQFRAANFNFKSTVYEWLVISGARAQYKGSGTINGSGNYNFMLTAIDGQINGGGGNDKFRLRIWDRSSGGIIYDNQVNGDMGDNATPITIIGGGSIVIHR